MEYSHLQNVINFDRRWSFSRPHVTRSDLVMECENGTQKFPEDRGKFCYFLDINKIWCFTMALFTAMPIWPRISIQWGN